MISRSILDVVNEKLMFMGGGLLLVLLCFSLWGGVSWGFLLHFRCLDTVEALLLVNSLEATVTHLG